MGSWAATGALFFLTTGSLLLTENGLGSEPVSSSKDKPSSLLVFAVGEASAWVIGVNSFSTLSLGPANGGIN